MQDHSGGDSVVFWGQSTTSPSLLGSRSPPVPLRGQLGVNLTSLVNEHCKQAPGYHFKGLDSKLSRPPPVEKSEEVFRRRGYLVGSKMKGRG